jgi:hypothetical protein
MEAEMESLNQLRKLKTELEDLTLKLRAETRTAARWLIMGRMHEILCEIRSSESAPESAHLVPVRVRR